MVFDQTDRLCLFSIGCRVQSTTPTSVDARRALQLISISHFIVQSKLRRNLIIIFSDNKLTVKCIKVNYGEIKIRCKNKKKNVKNDSVINAR